MRLVNTTSFRKASIGQESIRKPSICQVSHFVKYVNYSTSNINASFRRLLTDQSSPKKSKNPKFCSKLEIEPNTQYVKLRTKMGEGKRKVQK